MCIRDRKDTADRAIGLEVLPSLAIDYGGKLRQEMNVAAIRDRQPQLVLIDELAHTNIPGSAQPKRYQDVELVLDAGIDVFSTVNIQHLESLNDLIAEITGVIVRERIPDRLLDEADEVVVVDVTPETLVSRLQEGKVYPIDRARQSLDRFFQHRNLVALRELALREVADSIEGHAILASSNGHSVNIQERVLVCISTYENSLRLIRRASRLASYMSAPLYGVFVCDPDRFLSKEEALHIELCQKLCEEFEGTFLRVLSTKVPQAIATIAEQNRISQIVIGESQRSRWHLLWRGSLTHQLMRLLRGRHVDLHIIGTD